MLSTDGYTQKVLMPLKGSMHYTKSLHLSPELLYFHGMILAVTCGVRTWSNEGWKFTQATDKCTTKETIYTSEMQW